MSTKIGFDPTFQLNEFGKPKLSSEIELVKNTILYILFSKPGQYPSLPTVGMNIENMLYSFYDEISIDDIKKEIINQCAAMALYINSGNIQIKKMRYKNQPSLLIYIQGNAEYYNNQINDTSNSNQYMIGITFDEMHKMIYNVSENGVK